MLANRAACHLKLRQASRALDDATWAVDMDPSYDKAHYRLAHALEGVGRRSEAHAALKKAKELQAIGAGLGGAMEPDGNSAMSKDAGVADAAAAMVAPTVAGATREVVRVAQIIEALKPTLAGSETRRALVEELHTILSHVSETGSDSLQRMTARAFADAKGPQVLWEIENSMRGNWVNDAKNGTMSKISKIFELPGAVCKAAINYRKHNANKQVAAMCTPDCNPDDDDCCWASSRSA